MISLISDYLTGYPICMNISYYLSIFSMLISFHSIKKMVFLLLFLEPKLIYYLVRQSLTNDLLVFNLMLAITFFSFVILFLSFPIVIAPLPYIRWQLRTRCGRVKENSFLLKICFKFVTTVALNKCRNLIKLPN